MDGTDAIRKGWVEPMAEAGIPAIRSGEFPARILTGPTQSSRSRPGASPTTPTW